MNPELVSLIVELGSQLAALGVRAATQGALTYEQARDEFIAMLVKANDDADAIDARHSTARKVADCIVDAEPEPIVMDGLQVSLASVLLASGVLIVVMLGALMAAIAIVWSRLGRTESRHVEIEAALLAIRAELKNVVTLRDLRDEPFVKQSDLLAIQQSQERMHRLVEGIVREKG